MTTLKFRAFCKKCKGKAHFDLEEFDDGLILAAFSTDRSTGYTCPVTEHGHYMGEDIVVEVSVNDGKWKQIEE